MPYRLHYFPESGNSYKLALMLTLCGEQWEPVWIRQWASSAARLWRRRSGTVALPLVDLL